MKNPRCLFLVLCMVFVAACLQVPVLGQTADDNNKLANFTSGGSSVRWEMLAPYSELTLTVSAPDGRIFRKEFKAGAAPEFTIADKSGERLPDGQYTYELRLSPTFTPGVKKALAAARGNDDEPEEMRAARKRGAPAQNLVQSGGFSILNGAVVEAGAIEAQRT